MSMTWFLEVDGVLHPGKSLGLPDGDLALEVPGAKPFCLAHHLHPSAAGMQVVLLVPWLSRLPRTLMLSQLPGWLQPVVVDILDTNVNIDDSPAFKRRPGTWPAVSEYLHSHGLQSWMALVADDQGWPRDGWVRERLCALTSPSGLEERSAREVVFTRLSALERQTPTPYTVTLGDSYMRPQRAAIQERWLMRLSMPALESKRDVEVVVCNEQDAKTYECVLPDQAAGPLLPFIARAFCLARWGQCSVPDDAEAGYLWSEATLEIRRGDGMVPAALLRLTLELMPREMRVVHRWAIEREVTRWQERSVEYLEPVRLLMRELLRLDERRRC